jgi:uncharacterized protein YkwD
VLSRAHAALVTAAVILVAGGSIAGASASSVRTNGRTAVSAMPALDQQLIAAIDAVRAQHGLQELRPSLRLQAAASFHSYEMANLGFFSHTSADGTSSASRTARYYPSAGYRRWHVGETMLWYSPRVAAADAVADWLSSPLHRAVLLSAAFREIGVSAVHVTAARGDFHGAEITLVTADFGVRSR